MAWTSIAVAQPGMAQEQPPPPPTTVSADSSQSSADLGIVNDVNAERGWLFPTALTQPKGTWTVSNYEILGFGLTYGVTDAIQFSVNTIIVPDEDTTPNWITAKAQILRSGRFRLAVHGATIFAKHNDSVGLLGLAGTMCIDTNCDSNVSGYAGRVFASEIDDDEKLVVMGITYTQKLSKGVKAVVELDEFREQRSYSSDEMSLLWYGLRFTNKKVGLDIGLMKPLGEADDEFPIGLPWINFTFRGGM